MRVLAVSILLLAACDFQPKNRDKRAAGAVTRPPPPMAKVEPGSAAPAPAPTPPRLPKPVMDTSADCEKVAIHVTTIVIDAIQDPSLKAVQQGERAKLVRKVSETCTKDKWTDVTRKCFLDGKTQPELEVCGRAIAAPAPDAPTH